MKSNRINPAVLFLIMCLALAGVYWNHFDNGFHFDDLHTIVNNEAITDISNVPQFFVDPRLESSLPENQMYRPMITSLNAIDHWLAGGLDTRVFHIHIFMEFLVLLLVLFFLLQRIFQASSGGRHPYVALLGTAFFAFHAATAETINYIIARSDEFSTLMVLIGLLIFVGQQGWKKQLALIPMVIGCLGKPTALMLAPLVVIYSLMMVRPSLTVLDEKPSLKVAGSRTLRDTSSFLLVGAGMYLFTRSMYPDTWIPGGDSALHYLNTQPYVVLLYLKTFLLPTGLTADTDLGVITELADPRVLAGLFVIAMMLLVAFLASFKRTSLPVSFGILWFFVTLAPTSSVIPLAEVLNHHRTFFPYIGLVMAVSWALYLTVSRISTRTGKTFNMAATVFCLVLIGAHAIGTWHRNEVWHSSLSLWRDTAEKSPNNGRGLMNYGLARMGRGEYEEALELFQKAQQTDYGRHAYLFINLGIVTNAIAERSNNLQLKSEAESYFQTALQLGPHYPATSYFYARWLHSNGRKDEALPLLHKTLELSPAHRNARDLLQKINMNFSEATDYAWREAERQGTQEAFMNLSLKFYNQGQWNECIAAAERALVLNPELAAAFNNICAARNQLNEFEAAIAACEEALRIQPDFPLASGNLNWARSQLK